MNAESVTVFVRKIGGAFHATIGETHAIHTGSAGFAARLCASRYFRVPQPEIEIDAEPGYPNVMTARIRQPEPVKVYRSDRALLVTGLGCLGLGVIAYFLLVHGGAQ